MNVEHRISNIEHRIMYSIYFYKKMERSDSTLRHSIFVIRYSAVRCSARLPAAKAASVIIKKPCHFGVVSYKYQTSPFPDTRHLVTCNLNYLTTCCQIKPDKGLSRDAGIRNLYLRSSPSRCGFSSVIRTKPITASKISM